MKTRTWLPAGACSSSIVAIHAAVAAVGEMLAMLAAWAWAGVAEASTSPIAPSRRVVKRTPRSIDPMTG